MSSFSGLIAATLSGRLPSSATVTVEAETSFNETQKAMALGQPIPIIWCRRRGIKGGVIVSPLATEARFSNNSSTINTRFHCVLSDGLIGDIQVRDFRVGGCRRGLFSQNYDKRAGAWLPGVLATQQDYGTPTFPTFTGGGGSYKGLSTLEFSFSVPGGSDGWNTASNIFIRDGRIVERGRLLDAVVGASDNVADLALHAIERSSRIPAALIDLDSFTQAARFTEANGFWYDGEIKNSSNLGDWLAKVLPLFLLRTTYIGGKHGLRPLLPANADGTINDGRLSADWLLTETSIKPNSFHRTWNDAGIVPQYQAMWRQQYSDVDPPIIRTLEVGEAGPTEQLDLSSFCTTELHCARAAHYQRALRTLSTHTATVTLRNGAQTGYMREGDIIQIKYDITTLRESGKFNEWYQVESIGQSFGGEEVLALTHFPVDEAGRSLLALAVTEATVSNILYATYQSGDGCDIFERETDESVPDKSTLDEDDPANKEYLPIVDGNDINIEMGGTNDVNGSLDGNALDWADATTSDPNNWNPNRGPGTNGPGTGGTGAGGRWGSTSPKKGRGSNGSFTPDRSPEASPPPNGGGQPTTPPGQGDHRCTIGYDSIDFTVIAPYTVGGGTVASNTTVVSNARTWPQIIRSNVSTVVSPFRQNEDYLQYTDSTGTRQEIVLTWLVPVVSGYPSYFYQIKIDDYGCLGDPLTSRGPEWYVRPGDTLSGIAGGALGDPSRAPEIFDANRDQLKSPDLLFPGQWLRLPNP